jgi:hypothetical protein
MKVKVHLHPVLKSSGEIISVLLTCIHGIVLRPEIALPSPIIGKSTSKQ